MARHYYYGFLVVNEQIIPHLSNTDPSALKVVTFFLLFLNKAQKDPTFGFYNLAHSDVRVFHSFKLKVAEPLINELQQVMLHQPGKLNSFSRNAA